MSGLPLPLLTGAQDPSQLNAQINALIAAINGNSINSLQARITAPIAAELVSISAAAIATRSTSCMRRCMSWSNAAS